VGAENTRGVWRRGQPEGRLLATLAVAALLATAACSATPEGNQVGFCAMLAGLGDLDSEIASGPDGLGTAAAKLDGLGDVAPPEIAPAVGVLATGVADMAAAASAARPGGTPAALDAAARAVEDRVGELEAASTELTGFAQERCGLELTSSQFPGEPADGRPLQGP